MIPRPYLIRAVFGREYTTYFTSPLGYVLITFFVLVGSILAFLPDAFFTRNVADLDSLNTWFPWLLMIFIPAITMGIWADERKQGTDELLLTLPATDFEIVIGKYLAALGIYLTSLAFSLTHVIVLSFLGEPDLSLMFSNYLSFALLGATFLSLGLVGSLLSSSMTVAFILSVLLCACFVFLDDGWRMLQWLLGRLGISVGDLTIMAPFNELASGVLSLSALVTTAAIIGTMIYLSLLILGVRRRGARQLHGLLRFVGVGAGAVALMVIGGRTALRADLTAEGLATLSEITRTTLKELQPDRPVFVRVYASKKVPPDYAPTRQTLLTLLRELEARSGGGLILDVTETEPDSPEAQDAEQQFGITAQDVVSFERGSADRASIFLGAAFTCGPEEVVVPFFFRSLPIEYELTRSIRVVSQASRKRIGVLTTDAKVFGGFNFQRMSSTRPWPIIEELKKQYEVVEVSPDGGFRSDLDLVLAVMPSTLDPQQLDRLQEYVLKGNPTLIVDDPLPIFNPGLAPSQPKGGPRNPFMQNQPPPKPKGNIEAFLRTVGVAWSSRQVVFDEYNPHPQFGEFEKEIIFVGPGSGSSAAFNPNEPAVSGLQEVMLLFAGYLRPAEEHDGLTFVPLLMTGKESGTIHESDIFQRSPFGMGPSGLNPGRPQRRTDKEYVLAALVDGSYSDSPSPPPGADGDPPPPSPDQRDVRVAVIADADLMSETFFRLYRDTPEDIQLDNVTFILNLIDVLAKDSSFVELRKRRPRHRTLTKLEQITKEFEDLTVEEVKQAEERAKAQIAEAQDRLDRAVAEVRERPDLDARARRILLRQREDAEQRKLEVKRVEILRKKDRAIRLARTEKKVRIDDIRDQVRFLAVLLPPIPGIILAVFVFFVRASRERRGA